MIVQSLCMEEIVGKVCRRSVTLLNVHIKCLTGFECVTFECECITLGCYYFKPTKTVEGVYDTKRRLNNCRPKLFVQACGWFDCYSTCYPVFEIIYPLPTHCMHCFFLYLQTIFNMFKHKPKDAALLDIAIQFVKGTTIFRKLTVHEILWGE